MNAEQDTKFTKKYAGCTDGGAGNKIGDVNSGMRRLESNGKRTTCKLEKSSQAETSKGISKYNIFMCLGDMVLLLHIK